RHHAVGQRTHEDLVRPRIAHELHVDVAATLKPRGHADALHRAGGVGLEPGVRVDLFALDGDQARTRVRCPHADFDLFARRVVGLRQRQRQLCVAVERAGDVGGAGYRVVDAVEHAAVAVADLETEIAGRVGCQR